jgi:hypothetical protein
MGSQPHLPAIAPAGMEDDGVPPVWTRLAGGVGAAGHSGGGE